MDSFHHFVIKAEDIPATCFLSEGQPVPCELTWINRGTDRHLNPQSVELLTRTLFKPRPSPSVANLRQSAGLRVSFETEHDRNVFARSFNEACEQFHGNREFMLGTACADVEEAEQHIARLRKRGIPASAISVLGLSGSDLLKASRTEGHSPKSVAVATAGGGMLGALSGVAMLALVPGFGLVAATGAVAAMAIPSMACLGGIFGATGGAIARMLSDPDVEGRGPVNLMGELRQGNVVVLVDKRFLPWGGGKDPDSALELIMAPAAEGQASRA